MYFTCGCIVLSNGCRIKLCYQFLAIFLLGQDGNVPNERVGPPFLDNHYCGYQLEAQRLHLLSGFSSSFSSSY